MSNVEVKELGMVLESAPNSIIIEIGDCSTYDQNKQDLQIGKYIKVANGNSQYIIVTIQNIKAIQKQNIENPEKIDFRFQLNTVPIGLLEERCFTRGNITLPVPTEFAYMLSPEDFESIFSYSEGYNMALGKLSNNKSIKLRVNGDKLFSKHLAIVGSTGSGKSCTVSKILQEVVGIREGENQFLDNQRNAHIIIFDIHAEYKAAFSLEENQRFNLNMLDSDNLVLPYWLMNAEELESIFIESSESNSHNQISQFKQAVILNKKKYNPSVERVEYDTPVYFSIEEVCNYIENLNNEVIGKLADENKPKLKDQTLVEDRSIYFERLYDFVETSTAKAEKASNGPFYGEFNRFILRLRSKIKDSRLGFLFNPLDEQQHPYKTEDFEKIMKQFLGYIEKANISIVDVSGIPFEVLNICVSLMCRLIFDFCFHYSKLKHTQGTLNDVPVMIVCEEAHNYVPRKDGAQYNASKKSIERIAKEGRKYGLSLMVVSQRPSEVSETIFSQCNNFISLRLTNTNDQNYIKGLMPDNSNGIVDILPNLAQGEIIIVGDAVLMPSVAKLDMPNPQPNSQSIDFYQRWNEEWRDISFEDVIKRWRKEK